jgi:hypothetical protein
MIAAAFARYAASLGSASIIATPVITFAGGCADVATTALQYLATR